MGNATIREISFVDNVDAARDLAIEHWRETESNLSATPPDLHIEAYAAMESSGVLVTLGAFDESDRLIGYSVAIVGRHPHYSTPYAQHDVLFVGASARKGSVGLRLVRATEEICRARGALFIAWNAKIGSQFDKLLGALGMPPAETVYIKEL